MAAIPPPRDPEVARTRGRKAVLARHRPADDPERIAADRDFAAARITDLVRRIVDDAPQLTPEQIDRITGLLKSGSTKRDAA